MTRPQEANHGGREPFPRHVIDPRHGMSLADRVADVCRWAILRCRVRLSPTTHVRAPVAVCRALISSRSLPEALVSLPALAALGDPLAFELCCDDSIEPHCVQRLLAARGIHAEVTSRKDFLDACGNSGAATAEAFGRSFIWGTKFSFAVLRPSSLPVLYMDNDVLWFRPAVGSLGLKNLRDVLAVTDVAISYDPGFLSWMAPDDAALLGRSQPVCAGIFAIPAGYQLPPWAERYILHQLKIGEPGYFFEQTLIALLALKGAGTVPYDDLPTCGPRSTWHPSYRHHCWIAAHYAGPARRQFWRDAWSLQG
jgi:hypothetical protein